VQFYSPFDALTLGFFRIDRLNARGGAADLQAAASVAFCELMSGGMRIEG